DAGLSQVSMVTFGDISISTDCVPVGFFLLSLKTPTQSMARWDNPMKLWVALCMAIRAFRRASMLRADRYCRRASWTMPIYSASRGGSGAFAEPMIWFAGGAAGGGGFFVWAMAAGAIRTRASSNFRIGMT